ncbi:hypothetical protein HOT75_gp141 [Gordonia phage Daredevil]|uniref:Uncharacterized protein n=1 Tax=Gordonia phage Daredevil TaxID=2283286 RepID=A0A345MIZ6_9CAUD|nr:hypothetical protein HOT75_gp141 [Gordonia phage Daredevil]AXH70527.1 hypothetical protein SEA_DAREDEVIL_141 [Gordonia phage Daredevil]
MTRSIDHIVTTHQIAADRRARGLDSWRFRIDGYRDLVDQMPDEPSGIECAYFLERLLGLIKGSRWWAHEGEDAGDNQLYDLTDLVEEMECQALPPADLDADLVDELLTQLYDIADIERVWIQ